MAEISRVFGHFAGRAGSAAMIRNAGPGAGSALCAVRHGAKSANCAALHPGYSRYSRSLLLGTALASGLIALPVMLAPAPAVAQTACTGAGNPGAGPQPIFETAGAPIVCVNDADRTSVGYIGFDDAIYLATGGDGSYIDLTNRGMLTGEESGIETRTVDDDSYIEIYNTGEITVVPSGGSGYGIFARTLNGASPINIYNSGEIRVDAGGEFGYGILAQTSDGDSPIDIGNSGDIRVTGGDYSSGILAQTFSGRDSAVTIANIGDIRVTAGEFGSGILAQTFGGDSPIDIDNSGAIHVDAGEDGYGIFAETLGANSPITIGNEGPISVGADANGYGIRVRTTRDNSAITIDNSGAIDTMAGGKGYGIAAGTQGGDSAVVIDNTGAIDVSASIQEATGIDAGTLGSNSSIEIYNNAHIVATATADAKGYGVFALTDGAGSSIAIDNYAQIMVRADASGYGFRVVANISDVKVFNSGNIAVDAGNYAKGIAGQIFGDNASIVIENEGDVTITRAGFGGAYGIDAQGFGDNSSIVIENEGDVAITVAEYFGVGIRAAIGLSAPSANIVVNNEGDITVAAGRSFGIIAQTFYGPDSIVSIENDGDITVTGDFGVGIFARAYGANTPITIENSGDVSAIGSSAGTSGSGILAGAYGADSPVSIVNSGAVYGSAVGVSSFGASSTTINNLAGGVISSGTGLAIDVLDTDPFGYGYVGGSAMINNAGTILGFIDLTDNADSFTNQNGGLFQATDTSDFGDGDDVFTNEEGGTVDTADDPSSDESVQFVNLERFENFGTISLQDGAEGDLFTIADTLGGTGLEYIAGSTLAVDAFLGGPGSEGDILRIDGDVSGKTDVVVNNTNPGPGSFNAQGITVVQVRGQVAENAFRLADGPIDTGFFVYDLFFEEDGAAFDEFELRSFAGPGAFLLPQLVTAAQDIWHETSDTWFDRSADLRSFFFARPYAAAPVYTGGKDLGGVVAVPPLNRGPAVWARGSGAWIDRDETVRTEAFGRDFTFNLDNELHVADFQAGVDIHRRGVLSPGDVLLLTAFGGAVWADLDFDKIARRFDYEGGQAGAAVTYLNGGLFIDALFNAQFLEIEPEAFGFGPDIDADTYGFRVDSGYRFGLRSIFLEPLLTISYAESDLDGFTVGPNRVSFGDEHSLRGRVGLRAGTSINLWGVAAEPYVIASLWSELDDDDNRARLTSNGTSFTFEDENEDSWGEISFGSHYYLFGDNAVSAFTKTDIAFGDDYDAYAFKGGFRVNW